MKCKYTKAAMLQYLKENISTINILPIFVVESTEFFNNTMETVNAALEFAGDRLLIVRSSSTAEDTDLYSNAGKFESILNVRPQYEDVKDAVEKVYNSYDTNDDQEILIQPMLQNIRKSGVVFTADMDTFADYYTVNYYEGNDSAAVTGGSSDILKTFIKYKSAEFPVEDDDMRRLLVDCSRIEIFLEDSALDIEFAIDEQGIVYILQVRPIARGQKSYEAKVNLSPALSRIYKKAQKLSARHPFLLGDTTCFGVMPDWNPAEILGIRPKKLSISLYKELITDSIWAHQRYDYGYRDLTMHPLMISFCGVPYIDTRITFNSFVPQKLNEKIAEKLVNYYLNKLSMYPVYHDKIEFEIVFSCYYLGIHDKLKELLIYGFNENEITRIEFSLLELTNNIISQDSGLYKKDIQKITLLEQNYDKIVMSDISLVDKIYWLIEECKAYGTLPFAGVARAGFIAVQFLRSFVTIGIISQEEYDAYMNSLETINKKMNRDLRRYSKDELNKKEFLDKYGHIRPGTYDIMSKRYDEAFDEYFEKGISFSRDETEETFSFSEAQMSCIQTELEQNGLLIAAKELLVFIKESIEGREYLKFVFTKSVSKILQLIEELGIRAGISKEDMAFLDISVVKQLYVDLYTGDIRTIFRENIEHNKIQYQSAVQLKLPSIIVKPEDIYSFYLLSEEPNFITHKSVTAQTVVLESEIDSVKLEGNIIFIQAADPGYDFLFSKGIGGLVTQFGGVNSHMAIRCAELGIPAVIGVGEKNYTEWSRCRKITIDCLKKQIIKIE
ncbi:MAG: phosphoenolpyruvate synthase [Lachnospiraceae bacterium]|nr:phosphoenolpyruvate synthase [Lachnospiraceae bacterium]